MVCTEGFSTFENRCDSREVTVINSRRRLVPLILIFFAGLILSLPALLFGFPFYGDDSVAHAISYSSFADHLWQGVFYPRWIHEMNGGLGGTFFYLYAPVPYYITSILHPFFRGDKFGWLQLGVGASLAVVLSGLTFFHWIRSHAAAWPAVLAAIVYMALPYHVNIDLYTRGAYAEIWSFVWFPLLLWTSDKARSSKIDLIWTAVVYALLIMTHLPSALIFSPVMMTYPLICFAKSERIKGLIKIVFGMLLGLTLSAIYLIPAIALQKFTFSSEAATGHYSYENWFMFTGLNWTSVRADLFWFTLEVLALSLLAYAVARVRGRNGQVRFWLVILIAGFLAMTPLVKPIWELLPIVQNVQFPWRFNMVMTLAASTLIAFALTLETTRSALETVFRVALIVLMVVWTYDLAKRSWFSYPSHHVDEAAIRERTKWLDQKRDQNEFRPRWVVSIKEDDLDGLLARVGKSPGIQGVASLEGSGKASIQRWDRKQIIVDINSPQPDMLKVSQFYFPGWHATTTDSPLDVKPSIPGGLVSIAVPSGAHRVVLKRILTRPEKIGMGLSAATVLVLLGLAMRGLAKSRN